MDTIKPEKPKKKQSLLPFGSALFFGAFTINAMFMLGDVGGYLREVTRLATLVGLVVFIIGIVQVTIRAFKKKA